MEGDSTNGFDMEAFAQNLDESLANVMPDTWIGHARIVIAGHDLSDKQKAKVLRVTEKLVDEKDAPADKLAEICIKKIE